MSERDWHKNDLWVFFLPFQIRIASTLGGFFLMMVLLVLYKSKCKTRSLSDQHLEAVIKAAVDQEEQLAALAKRSSSSSYCSGHGLCRCSPSKNRVTRISGLIKQIIGVRGGGVTRSRISVRKINYYILGDFRRVVHVLGDFVRTPVSPSMVIKLLSTNY